MSVRLLTSMSIIKSAIFLRKVFITIPLSVCSALKTKGGPYAESKIVCLGFLTDLREMISSLLLDYFV